MIDKVIPIRPPAPPNHSTYKKRRFTKNENKIIAGMKEAVKLSKAGKLDKPLHLGTIDVRVHLSGPGAPRTQAEVMRELDNKRKL